MHFADKGRGRAGRQTPTKQGERFPRRRNITVIHEPAEELARSKPEGHVHGHSTGPEKRGRTMKWEGQRWPGPGTASFFHAHRTPPEASKRGWRPGYSYLIYEYIPEIVLMNSLLRWTNERRKVGGGIQGSIAPAERPQNGQFRHWSSEEGNPAKKGRTNTKGVKSEWYPLNGEHLARHVHISHSCCKTLQVL